MLAASALVSNKIQARAMGSCSANDKVSVALIGCRSMGWSNLLDFLQHKNVECLALCDVCDDILTAKKQELKNNFQQTPKTYKDYRFVLDRKDIDIIIIGTPDHWHCLQFVDACSAGKSVYVEKPIANSIAECKAMEYAANRYNTVVQVGQQQRSSDHWQKMVEYLHSGKLGKVGLVDVWGNFNYGAINNQVDNTSVPIGVDFDMWLGPTPKVPFNPNKFHGAWRMFWNYGGGLLTDWGVHLLDMALWGMKVNSMPNQVVGIGGNYLYPQGMHETFDTLNVLYQFDNFTINWSNSTVEKGLGERHYGVLFRGTNGILVADRDNWEVIPSGNIIPPFTMHADYKDHFNHVTNFLTCVDTKNRATACPITIGSLCAKYAQIGNISARMGGVPLVYDDLSMSFNNKKAKKYIKPKYHNSWEFPKIK